MAAAQPSAPVGRLADAWASSGTIPALAVFAIVLAVASFSIARRCPLGSLGGLVDEHVALGIKLRINGTLGPARDEPSTLRPPGYPGFVAAAVALLTGPPAATEADVFRESAYRAVYAVQALTLAATATLLFLWLAERLRRSWALTAAVVFGLNPYVLVLVGLLHYAVLHLLFVVASAWALQLGLDRPRGARVMLGAGAVTGLANLVRPVTLLLPAFLLLAAVVRWPIRDALARVTAFTAGMIIVLAPWAVRNWTLTGRVVLVGDSGWVALWSQTTRPTAMDPARYEWYDVVERDFAPLFTRATGADGYDYLALTRHVSEVERVFRAEALANLSRQPAVYAGNVMRALRSYLLDLSPIFLDVFRDIQAGCAGRTPEIPRVWFLPGGREFGDSPLTRSFMGAFLAVTLAAAAGMVLGVWNRDSFVLAPALVLGAMALTHALVLLSPMHHYSKLPLVGVLAASAADVSTRAMPRLRRTLQVFAVAATAGFTAAFLL